nr:MAG TPA: NikA, BACTERIAL CONJUGATION, RELAXASE, DNA [Caudoviricetes sp.]
MRKGSKKENGKTRRFSTRLTENEYKEFSEKAEKRQMTKTDYMLYLIKNDKLKK